MLGWRYGMAGRGQPRRSRTMGTRLIGICPAGTVDEANAALDAAGFGPQNFSVPLLPNPHAVNAPVKEYATDWNATEEEWVRIKEAVDGLGVVWYDEGNRR